MDQIKTEDSAHRAETQHERAPVGLWVDSGALHLLMLAGLCLLIFVLNTAVWKVGP